MALNHRCADIISCRSSSFPGLLIVLINHWIRLRVFPRKCRRMIYVGFLCHSIPCHRLKDIRLDLDVLDVHGACPIVAASSSVNMVVGMTNSCAWFGNCLCPCSLLFVDIWSSVFHSFVGVTMVWQRLIAV